MLSYTESSLPIRSDLEAAHRGVWESLAAPGTWWTAAQRVAIAATARRARVEQGLAELPTADLETDAELPEAAREVARRVGAEPGSIDRTWFEKIVPGALSDAQYIEAVGVVARTASVDFFCRAAGLPLPPLPAPQRGEPSRQRPAVEPPNAGWLPMLPHGREANPVAQALFGRVPQANVVRALSLVPPEVGGVGGLLELSAAQYLPISEVGDPGSDPGRAIDRAQIEWVAGRVSAVNECFY